MKFLTRLLLILLALAVLPAVQSQAVTTSFADENLHYVISYKWGMIHKDAGTATLSLRNRGKDYSIMLTGKTKPWADSFFSVRDTLTATVAKNGFLPIKYVKSAHEGGKYSRDVITYSRAGGKTIGHCSRYRDKKGNISKSEKTLSATGPVFDMLSVFYYLRTIDYAALQKGKVMKMTVFSGSKSETLTLRCLGTENIKMRNKIKRDAYHIKFNFTTEGKKKSSDDIDCWISTDSSHIPLLLIGSLPVGQVKCYFVG